MEKEIIWQSERISIKSLSDIVNKVPLEDTGIPHWSNNVLSIVQVDEDYDNYF
jgi:hypothetical protein